jgi:hypothetical protein
MKRGTIHKLIVALSGILTVGALLVFSSMVAGAQNIPGSCGARADVVTHLDKKFGEQRNNMMLDARGNLVEMFSNHDTGSWTLTVTIPDGPTCVVNSGESFVQEVRMNKVEELGS